MMLKKTLQRITYALWIICLVLAIDYVTGFILKIGQIVHLSFFVDLHTYVVSAGQFIIGGGIIFGLLLFAAFASDSHFIKKMLFVHDTDKRVEDMEAEVKRELDESRQRIDTRIAHLEERTSKLQTQEKLLEQEIALTRQHQRLTLKAHKGQLLQLIARNTKEISKIAHNTGLKYYFHKLADEAQVLLDKLK